MVTAYNSAYNLGNIDGGLCENLKWFTGKCGCGWTKFADVYVETPTTTPDCDINHQPPLPTTDRIHASLGIEPHSATQHFYQMSAFDNEILRPFNAIGCGCSSAGTAAFKTPSPYVSDPVSDSGA